MPRSLPLALATALLAAARTTPAQTEVPAAPVEEPSGTAETATGPATPEAPAEAPPAAPAPTALPAPPAPAAVVTAPSPATAPAEPAVAVAAPPQKAPPASPQPKRLPIYTWGSVGTTFAYDRTYASLNLGVGVMWKAGLAPNAELSYAFGNDPTLWTLRPGLTWFLPVPGIQPYVGAYYTHWFVGSSLPDQNGVGGRAGLSIGRVISLGVTYDHALGCTTNCDIWTPQISASLSM